MFPITRIRCHASFLKQIVTKRSFHVSSIVPSKVAVVLSGCGVYDGSEIHESSAVIVHLSRANAEVAMFAPDAQQMHAINHLKGEPLGNNRNILEESARIARGNIKALSNLDPSQFDAVIFPGGFGAAKNLEVDSKEGQGLALVGIQWYGGAKKCLLITVGMGCFLRLSPLGLLSSFAVDGPEMKVNSDVEKVLKSFHTAKKPIGLCCIAPVLAAKVIPGCEVTVGSESEEGGKWPYAGTAQAVNSMGAKHIKKDVHDIHIDKTNKIVTTPAFMCETKVHEIFDGVGQMVTSVLKLCK